MNEKKIILLDPGHGWSTSAGKYQRPLMVLKNNKVHIASSTLKEDPREHMAGFYREDHGTLLISIATAKYLSDLGYEVYFTRSDHRNANEHLEEILGGSSWQKTHWKSWQWITTAAIKYKADAFISIHTNATTSHNCSGVAGFYADDIKGKALATSIVSNISNEFGLKIRRIAEHHYLILQNTCKGNACLIECAFHDYPKDLALLTNEESIDKFGKMIAEGTHKYLI